MTNNRYLHYGFVLAIIAAISAGILAFVNQLTVSVIKNNEMAAVNAARKIVLPIASTFNDEDKITLDKLHFIPGQSEDGKVIGYVVTVSQPGYAANIDFVLGIDMDGKVTGLDIIGSQETPGLGSKIKDVEWTNKAIGRDVNYNFDKTIDGFAGATISPQAVYTGIKRALKSFESGVKK